MNLKYVAGAGIFVLMMTGMASIALAQQSKIVELYKSPYYDCCGAWGDHMEAAGFQIKEHNGNTCGAVMLSL